MCRKYQHSILPHSILPHSTRSLSLKLTQFKTHKVESQIQSGKKVGGGIAIKYWHSL